MTLERRLMAEWLEESVATFCLVGTILAFLKATATTVPMAVGHYITAGFWFTSFTSFASPPVNIAHGFSNTFAGIAPTDVAAFMVVQLIAAAFATSFFLWMLEDDADD